MTDVVMQAATWALVPLKSPDRAKSRLADVLSPARRASLFLALAERVIRTLRATPGIDYVAVVTASPVIADFSRSLQAHPLLQTADAGMSAALEVGLRKLHAFAPNRVLMIPGDLPLISPAALEEFFAGAGGDPGVAIAPDRHGVGTNLLLCAPPHAIAPCFGGHSFERHLAAAAAAGIDARVLHIKELALDLDEPQDLEFLQSQNTASAAQLFEARPRDAANTDVHEAWHRAVAAGSNALPRKRMRAQGVGKAPR
jgi:2-phospho-L-lactate guanylyltransferase